jgi:23S rRNA (cytidine2498-2'-O)-methyltransferase
MMAISSGFLFAICQPTAQAWLKEEVSARHPNLRFAYSRPGFLTFKSMGGPLTPGELLNVIFARCWGLVLGQAIRASEHEAIVEQVARRVEELGAGQRLHLHTYRRDEETPTDGSPIDPEVSALDQLARRDERLRERLHKAETTVQVGDLVLHIIIVGSDEVWLGLHQHTSHRWTLPGGRLTLERPEAAPSRVYHKLEEALAWSRAPLERGQTALDIGCSPGGGTYALLQRGLRVVGVDPAELEPALLAAYPDHLTHIAKPFQYLSRDELPEQVDWLIYDVNLNPNLVLNQLKKLARSIESLRGVLVTLKLNHPDSIDKIPWMLDKLRAIGIPELRATQLPANRSELFAYGLIAR